MISISQLWKERQCCLELDSIQFGDGRVALLSVDYPDTSVGSRDLAKHPVTVRAWTHETALDEAHLSIVETFALTREIIQLDNAPLTVLAGECGSTLGFVAASRQEDELMWLAFFTKSNGFTVLDIRDDTLHAVTNLGVVYEFPLRDPVHAVAEILRLEAIVDADLAPLLKSLQRHLAQIPSDLSAPVAGLIRALQEFLANTEHATAKSCNELAHRLQDFHDSDVRLGGTALGDATAKVALKLFYLGQSDVPRHR